MRSSDCPAFSSERRGGGATSKRIGPPARGVVEREVAGCFVLLCPEEEHVLLLNETASDVWRLVSGDLSLEKIVDLLARAYHTEPGYIYEDVELTVARLRDHGLLSVAE